MRITNQVLYQTVTQGLQRSLAKMRADQIEMASQRRINRLADDPAGSAQARALRSDLAGIAQFQRNIENGINWMQSTETALDNLDGVLQRAKVLAVEGGSANRTAADREQLAVEVNQLLESALGIANSEVGDEFLFAGLDTDAAPFVASRNSSGEVTSVAMSGDPTGSIRREVETGSYVAINVSGSAVFDVSDGPFATLISLRDALRQNNIGGIQDTLNSFDNNLDEVLSSRGAIGGMQARLEMLQERLALRTVDTQSAVSDIEDVDFAELLTRSSADETAYRAALSSGSRLLQTTVLDYLS
jgi:flagellar hook-associated protein 3 FlgL